jgi:uncharacterized protein (TIGR02118 family)
MKKIFFHSIIFTVLISIIVGCDNNEKLNNENEPVNTSTTSNSAGFKFMVLIKKQDAVSFEEYERYFMDTHLPYVLAIPGLQGYKINMRHPTDDSAQYDGISEFWFDDRAAFDSAMASPETKATLDDAAKFLMPPQILLVDERVIVSPGQVKNTTSKL